MNQLHFGDNLDVLRNTKLMKDESVDLIYLDPPFNSKANYSVFFADPLSGESEAQAEAFKDTWTWGPVAKRAFDDVTELRGDLAILMGAFEQWLGRGGLLAYLSMMGVRLIELHRVLKPTGSLFLHCDPNASAYLKLMLDAIFGRQNFRNEVIWDYSFRLMDLPRFFNRKHDDILFYAKGPDAYFKMPKTEWTREDLVRSRKQKIHTDEEGFEWIWMPGGRGNSKNKLRRVDEIIEGGKAISDVWPIPIISSSSRERVGYPTQKPLALLHRIIDAASREGEIVFDPFCGCGTTVEAAESMGRQWIGIDISHYAVTVIETRLAKLKRAHPTAPYEVLGRPVDIEGARDLAKRDKHQFQWWAAWKLGSQTYGGKKGGDKGVDGRINFANGPYGIGRIIISAKGGENLKPEFVRELAGTLQAENADMGILVTLGEPTRGMIGAAADQGYVSKSAHGRMPRVQIVTAQELLDGRMPMLPPLPIVEDGPTLRRRKTDRDQLELLLPFAGATNLRLPDGSMVDPRYARFA